MQVKYQCKMTATFMDDCSSVTKVEDFFFIAKTNWNIIGMAIWIKMFRNNSWSLTQGGSQLQPQEIKMHQGCQCELWRLERMLGEYHDNNLLFWCVTIWALLTIMTTEITLATFRSVESTRTPEKSNLLAVFPSMALVNHGCIVGKTCRRRRHSVKIAQTESPRGE